MKIIGIEDSTFESVMERFNAFASRIKKICGKDIATEKWMDNQDVCNLLDISKRTLQVTEIREYCLSLKSDINVFTKLPISKS